MNTYGPVVCGTLLFGMLDTTFTTFLISYAMGAWVQHRSSTNPWRKK